MHIREVAPDDAAEWAWRRAELWSGDHEREIAEFLAGSRAACEMVYVIDRGEGRIGGFIELSTRSYAEGCATSPVAYVEGWYVDADLRRTGVGRRLMEAAETWDRDRGYSELASDCDIDNEISFLAHPAIGFDETDRIICIRKEL